MRQEENPPLKGATGRRGPPPRIYQAGDNEGGGSYSPPPNSFLSF